MDAAALWSHLSQATPDLARLASLGALATRLRVIYESALLNLDPPDRFRRKQP